MRALRSKYKITLEIILPDKIHFQTILRKTKSLTPLTNDFRTLLTSIKNSAKSRLIPKMKLKGATRKIELKPQIKSLTTASAAAQAMTKSRCSGIQSCKVLILILIKKCQSRLQRAKWLCMLLRSLKSPSHSCLRIEMMTFMMQKNLNSLMSPAQSL